MTCDQVGGRKDVTTASEVDSVEQMTQAFRRIKTWDDM